MLSWNSRLKEGLQTLPLTTFHGPKSTGTPISLQAGRRARAGQVGRSSWEEQLHIRWSSGWFWTSPWAFCGFLPLSALPSYPFVLRTKGSDPCQHLDELLCSPNKHTVGRLVVAETQGDSAVPYQVSRVCIHHGTLSLEGNQWWKPLHTVLVPAAMNMMQCSGEQNTLPNKAEDGTWSQQLFSDIGWGCVPEYSLSPCV